MARFFIGLITSIFFFANSNSQTKWRFAVVGDTHIGLTDTVAEMIPYMIADSIDLVLVPGDIVQAGRACSAIRLNEQLTKWQNVFAPLYNSGIGVYPIRGNHENDARNDISVWNSVFSGSYLLPQNGLEGEKNLTYAFNHKNALFIGLDNYVNIHSVNQSWLNNQLKLNTLPHVFVFGHEPAFKVFHNDCLDDSISARDAFWRSLSESNVKVYFCGHDHFVDAARIDDGDGNLSNDVYQYISGSGGGPLKIRNNYDGNNSIYSINGLFHEIDYGYALVEIYENNLNEHTVTIKWKKRVRSSDNSKNEYKLTKNNIQYVLRHPSVTK
jgi:3',5'-cyclic AMP phosphodiesterase CpdA